MLDFTFDIEIRYIQDFEDLVELLKAEGIDYGQFKIDGKSGYIIRFVSDYGEYELMKKIEGKFHFYEMRTDLGASKFDIRVQIKRNKSPNSTDSWGRDINTENVSEHFYLVIEEQVNLSTVRIRQIAPTSIVACIQVQDSKTKELGYMLSAFSPKTIFNVDLSKGQRLFPQQFFKTESDAWIALETAAKKNKSAPENVSKSE